MYWLRILCAFGAVLLGGPFNLLHGQPTVDSLMQAFAGAATPEAKGRIASRIANLTEYSNPSVSIEWARRGFAEVGALDIRSKVALANTIGTYYAVHAKYDSGLRYYNAALASARVMNDAKLEHIMLTAIGQLYSVKGDYGTALRYQLAVLAYYESQQAEGDIAYNNIAVGNTYLYMEKPGDALWYFRRALPRYDKLPPQAQGALLNSMAVAHHKLRQYNQEAPLLLRSLALGKQHSDSDHIAKALNNLGLLETARGDKTAARDWLQQALAIQEALGNREQAAEVRVSLAALADDRKSLQDAIRQNRELLAMARTSGDRRTQQEILRSLVTLYDSLHDAAGAKTAIEAYAGLTDTMSKIVYQREIADAETRYETQKALRERDRLGWESRAQALSARQAKAERNIAIAIGAGSAAALCLIFALLLRIRGMQAKSRQERSATNALFEGEQAERIRIARDLHDSIGQHLAVMKMQLSSPPANEAEGRARLAELVDKTVTEMRVISHNLIPEDLTFGTVRALENLCARMAEAGGIDVKVSISDAVRAHRFNQQFSLSLYRIVQEVLGNMMKHSGATAAALFMSQSGSKIVLELSDNGKGFDTSIIHASKGIGWKNVFARVRLLNGSVDVRSERISGTRIQISIPQ